MWKSDRIRYACSFSVLLFCINFHGIADLVHPSSTAFILFEKSVIRNVKICLLNSSLRDNSFLHFLFHPWFYIINIIRISEWRQHIWTACISQIPILYCFLYGLRWKTKILIGYERNLNLFLLLKVGTITGFLLAELWCLWTLLFLLSLHISA